MFSAILADITLRNIPPEIYLSLKDFENKAEQDQQETIQVADIVLQTLINSLLTEDQYQCTDPAPEEQKKLAIAPYWLPSATNSHIPAQQYEEATHVNPPQDPKSSSYTSLQKPLWKLNQGYL